MNQTRAIVRDLSVDFRCAIRDGMHEYAEKCRKQISAIYRNRHGIKLDRYGWPSETLSNLEESK